MQVLARKPHERHAARAQQMLVSREIDDVQTSPLDLEWHDPGRVGRVDGEERAVCLGRLTDSVEILDRPAIRANMARGDHRRLFCHGVSEPLERHASNTNSSIAFGHEERKEQRVEFVSGNDHLIARPKRRG